jgi:transcriptional regulator with XRE-family HTH domain
VPKTPKRAGREPHPEARFPSQVLAANIASFRAGRGIGQDELADRMRRLRHGWSRATLSEVERGDRNVTVDELGSLTVALGASLSELLDPERVGVNLDLGMPGWPVRRILASAWARGLLRITSVEGASTRSSRRWNTWNPRPGCSSSWP